MPKVSIITGRFNLLLVGLLFFLTNEVAGQGQSPTIDTTKETVFIDNADRLEVLRSAGDQNAQLLVGNVELSQDSIYMYCDSAELINDVQVYAFDNVIIQQGDSIAAFSEYLDYNATTQLANLRQNVTLQNGSRELYTEALNYNLATKLATYLDGGRLTDGETQLYSTRGYYYAALDRIYFRDSVVVVGEEFELRADTLMYDAKLETVYFLGPTVIRTDTAEIYCEDGFYNVATNQATFRQNAQYKSGEQIATADSIKYFGAAGEYVLDGRAYIREGDESLARADKITYRKQLESYQLEGNALLKDSARTVRGEYVEYDEINNTYKVSGGRSTVIDGNNILQADTLDFDNVSGLGIASGNVVWQDTSAQLEIQAALAQYNQETGYLKASGGKNNRALLITILDGDSLYMTADTLFSFKEDLDTSVQTQELVSQTDSISPPDITLQTLDIAPQPDSISPPDSLVKTQELASQPAPPDQQTRRISAYRDVRVYKSDMQALCDSLAFNTTDSILTLFEAPILWQDTSQLLADTIDIYLKNDALDKVHLKKRALVVTSPDLIFFNQIKGKNIYAFFDSTQLRRTDVQGNAEVIYYAQDEGGAYIGVNKTACSAISMDFRNGSIEFIRFLTAPSGRLDPLNGMTSQTQPTLEGFRWEVDARPASLADLFGPPLR